MTIGVTILLAALIVGLIERCSGTNDEKDEKDEKEQVEQVEPKEGWLFHKFVNDVNEFKIARKTWVDHNGFKPVNDNIIVLLQFLLIYKDDLTFEQTTYMIQALHDKLTKEAKEAKEANEAQEAKKEEKEEEQEQEEEDEEKTRPRKHRSRKRFKRYVFETRYQSIFEPRFKNRCRKGKTMKPRLDYVSRRSVPP